MRDKKRKKNAKWRAILAELTHESKTNENALRSLRELKVNCCFCLPLARSQRRSARALYAFRRFNCQLAVWLCLCDASDSRKLHTPECFRFPNNSFAQRIDAIRIEGDRTHSNRSMSTAIDVVCTRCNRLGERFHANYSNSSLSQYYGEQKKPCQWYERRANDEQRNKKRKHDADNTMRWLHGIFVWIAMPDRSEWFKWNGENVKTIRRNSATVRERTKLEIVYSLCCWQVDGMRS